MAERQFRAMTDDNAIEDSLMRVGLDPAQDTAVGAMATARPGNAILGTVQATHAVIIDNEILRVALAVGDEVVASIPLGPSDAIALASDLLLAARRRLGR